jgi:uncharacterized protein (DUF2235 family)
MARSSCDPGGSSMKRLIVLSDGTGNSAAALAKTNVWRTYQALDLSQGDQLAQYDDGVGTSSMKPLAILGGAFGWGLKRNVLHLYKFLCRNYEPGDEIHAFGFSRGAFTIRLLMGLVLKQGLVRDHSEEELEYLANAAYRAYRKQSFNRPASLSTVGRWFRDIFVALQNRMLGLAPYTKDKNVQVAAIKYLGLWDTVDAYGMPIKELKAGIDRFIWPLIFDSNTPSGLIGRARHALALDDERETFHPLVWDTRNHPNPAQIEQVWFSGMHANVGGGYHDDSLAHVPLMWVIEGAQLAGLRFKPSVLAGYAAVQTPFGRMHDSRSGITSYYRYSPRMATALSAPLPAVIHPSVHQRIAQGGDRYAPISIPCPAGKQLQYDMAWDTVWWRRVAYWSMLLVTAFLASLAFWELPAPWGDPWAKVVVDPLIDWAKGAVSILADPLDGMRSNPTAVLACAVGIVACFMWGRLLAGRVNDRAEEIWEQKPTSNQLEWTKQSIQRWRGTSTGLVVIAVAILLATWHLHSKAYQPWIAVAVLVAAVAFAAWRRSYDAHRLADVKAGKVASIRGWSLRLAYRVRTSTGIVAFAKWMSHTAVPFLFAVALLGGVAYGVYRLLGITGFFGMYP